MLRRGEHSGKPRVARRDRTARVLGVARQFELKLVHVHAALGAARRHGQQQGAIRPQLRQARGGHERAAKAQPEVGAADLHAGNRRRLAQLE